MQNQQGWDGTRCNNPSEQIPVGDGGKGTESCKTTAIAWSNFKWSYWTNSCLLRNIFHKRAHPHSLPLSIDSNTTCPEMPRSALQGQMAISEQPEQCWAHTMSHRAVSSPQVMFSSLLQAEPSHSPVCSLAASLQFGEKLRILQDATPA